MKNVLIQKDSVAYAAKTGGGTITGITEINSLAEGALVCLEQDGKLVSSTVPVPTADYVYFVQGRPSGYDDKKISLINRATLEYHKKTYVAPVAAVTYVGDDQGGSGYSLNLPTYAAGDTAGVIIIDQEKAVEDTTRKIRCEYIVKTGDTDQIIVDGLVAVILANSSAAALVTPAAVDTDEAISFTGVTAGKGFSVLPYGILKDADVVEGGTGASTALVIGQGTSANALADETAAEYEDGAVGANVPFASSYNSNPSSVVSGETYTTYVLTWTYNRHNMPINESQNPMQELVIYVSSTDTTIITAMDTILAAL